MRHFSLYHFLSILLPTLVCGASSLASVAAAEPTSATNPALGIRVHAGFEISLFAGDELAHDIFCLTLDSRGRAVVSGPGYIKTLHDDNQDGQADRATLFSNLPASGAHGLVFVENRLFCTGDDGVFCFEDENADGVADGPPKKLAALRTPEHGANAIIQGPDGWLYVICGNDAGIESRWTAAGTSPLHKLESGAVLRLSPDGQQLEAVAQGFRNPYDLAFNAAGDLFTVDSDGERDHHLPWYEPTRLFDIGPGQHHGWVLAGFQRSWSRPECFVDNVPRIVEFGRGSPTGLVVYRHQQFPSRYHGSVFSACWTLGKVYHQPLVRLGSSYQPSTKPEIFLETTGETGFAPVDLAIGLQGEMFVAVGGRRTRGSVFKVAYTAETKPAQHQPVELNSLADVLNHPEPLSAWSRAIWVPLAQRLGRGVFIDSILNPQRNPAERLRAVEIVTELFGGLLSSEAKRLMPTDNQPLSLPNTELLARVAWSLGRTQAEPEALQLLTQWTHHASRLVQRAAWQALLETDFSSKDPEHFTRQGLTAAAWEMALTSEDRRIFAHALQLSRKAGLVPQEATITAAWQRAAMEQRLPGDFELAAAALVSAKRSPLKQLADVRLMGLCLDDICLDAKSQGQAVGYSANARMDVVDSARITCGEKLARHFPTGEANLDEELARLLAMLKVSDSVLVTKLTEKLTEQSTPEKDLHYLMCCGQLPGERSTAATQSVAKCLAGLHAKMAREHSQISRNWPLRVGELLVQLCEQDSQLAANLLDQAAFGDPLQAFLALRLPAESRPAAAKKFVQRFHNKQASSSQTDDEMEQSPGEAFVQLVALLPQAESRPLLRELWADFSLRDAILSHLVKPAAAEDRPLLLEGLSSIQASTVEAAAKGLLELGTTSAPEDYLPVMLALRQACTAPEQRAVRLALKALLEVWSEEHFELQLPGKKETASDYTPWFTWFAEAHPTLSAKLQAVTNGDPAIWQARLEATAWDEGDVKRGNVSFQKRSCARCHAGENPLGPNLAGAAARFSRPDLLLAIVDPNREVAPLYQMTQIITRSGKVYSGLIVYESPDGTLLQTAPDQTVRIAGDEIVSMKKSKQSLMPGNLLAEASNEEIADLFAYLKTLRGK